MLRFTLAAIFLGCASIFFFHVRQDSGRELQGPSPPDEAVKPPPADLGRMTFAFVTATGPDWIEVRGPEAAGITRYPVAGEALAPPPPDLKQMVNSHRLWEVRPGDKVSMHLLTRAGIERCEEIVVYRRPGGVVPPRLGEVSDVLPEGTFAHRANAEQAFEERGVPLPPAYAEPRSPHLSGAPLVIPAALYPSLLPVAPPPRPVNRAP